MSAAPDATALELVVEAGVAKSREEWLFLLVNRSVGVAGYDRASAWSTAGTPELIVASGMAPSDSDGAFASAWKNALKRLRRPDSSAALGPDSFTDANAWAEVSAAVPGTSALWIPVAGRGVGFVFERWDSGFSSAETETLERLVAACSLAWGGGGRKTFSRTRKYLTRLAVLCAVTAVLTLVRIPLRIAAECEVAAKNPRLVAAPMDGVVESVTVAPGQRVAAGDALAVYDSRMMEEELNILRRQVEVAEAELATARARGFAEQRYRAETSRLEARLAQERARLRALEARYSLRVVAAPVAGMVQQDDPRAWRGRPVATGQAILWLVEPSDTRLKIWLPQDDRIDFDPERLAGVHLYALGGEARQARLTYVSTYAQPTGDGRYAFPAEAEWADGGLPPPLGLRGTAFLYGRDVSLGYWLARRPIGWLRRRLGV